MKIAAIGLMGNTRDGFPHGELEARRKKLESYVAKETEIDVLLPDEGTFWVDKPTEFDMVFITPFIVKRIIEAEKEGYDAAVVDCVFDPGVDEARCVVNIPVIGPGKVVMHMAGILGDRAGFLSPIAMAPHIVRFAGKCGTSRIVHYVEPVDEGPTEFGKGKEFIKKTFLSFADRAIKAGSQVLVPWGLPLVFAGGLDPAELTRELGVPVIDPHIYVKVAEDIVQMKLTHSRLAYPSPPTKQVDSLVESMKRDST